MVAFVRRWSQRTEIALSRLIGWLGVAASKFYHWQGRYGRVNERLGSHATSGWKTGRSARSSTSTSATRWKAIAV